MDVVLFRTSLPRISSAPSLSDLYRAHFYSVKHALQRGLSLIQGLPETGKTVTITIDTHPTSGLSCPDILPTEIQTTPVNRDSMKNPSNLDHPDVSTQQDHQELARSVRKCVLLTRITKKDLATDTDSV